MSLIIWIIRTDYDIGCDFVDDMRVEVLIMHVENVFKNVQGEDKVLFYLFDFFFFVYILLLSLLFCLLFFSESFKCLTFSDDLRQLSLV